MRPPAAHAGKSGSARRRVPWARRVGAGSKAIHHASPGPPLLIRRVTDHVDGTRRTTLAPPDFRIAERRARRRSRRGTPSAASLRHRRADPRGQPMFVGQPDVCGAAFRAATPFIVLDSRFLVRVHVRGSAFRQPGVYCTRDRAIPSDRDWHGIVPVNGWRVAVCGAAGGIHRPCRLLVRSAHVRCI